MDDSFFKQPILNSPYEYPSWHWELDKDGQPTGNKVNKRRRAEFITPIPKPKKGSKKADEQMQMAFDEGKGLSNQKQKYDPTPLINELRRHVDKWREIPNPSDWKVTPETAKLLQHWRHHEYSNFQPFFCQIEAVEAAIWLTEVAPKQGKVGQQFLEHLKNANEEANPGLLRIALKLATGAGKTAVMAMLIAWQTINAVRRPKSKYFTKGFLVVTPGITIKERLQVLQPNDPYSYYQSRELVPTDMLQDLQAAKIVITNYHAFKHREKRDISKGTRALLQGRGEPIETHETDGQMLQRVMPELMSMKNIMVLNDEAHHCYRENPESQQERLKREEKEEVEKSKEAARLWISGLEAVSRQIGIFRVMDLTATPFFLKGSGYRENTVFRWTMSDFSLMDAIECGIVKLPRVPVSDNIQEGDMPKFRNLWENIKDKMPKQGRGKATNLDPLSIPAELQTALEALYGHYDKTYKLWKEKGVGVPPCFIIVCNNTSTSKLVYDYISGFYRQKEDGSESFEQGRLELFRNFDENGNPYAKPNTLLIDSEQLESGEVLDKNFHKLASDEIERFKREIVDRTGNSKEAENITDQDILREVMNTVGKPGRLGESIRCVVSVSMLTEGWDANNVTHILGVRAFGTQLLCEQVIGRALRRQSYKMNEANKFEPEYADVLGIPFNFTGEPVVSPPQPPADTYQVRALSPGRDHLEIRFPNIQGYRVDLPEDRLEAEFNEDAVLELTPKLVGPSVTKNQGIIGEGVNLSLERLEEFRRSTIIYRITQRLLETKWRDPDGQPMLHLFGQLKRIVKQWLDQCLVCKGQDVYPALLLYKEIADMACERINSGIVKAEIEKDRPVKAIPDPFNSTGSTRFVNFNTSQKEYWQTSPNKSHINYIILDSNWEAEFCRVVEEHPSVIAYTKNHNLGFQVPYKYGGEPKNYYPDFIVLIDDGHGPEDPLHLVVEIKGYRNEQAKEKKATIENYWIPGVNNLEQHGRWAFVEFRDIFGMGEEFQREMERAWDKVIQSNLNQAVTE
jgi:type III restriction enzyme